MEALSDSLFARIDKKFSGWRMTPGRKDAASCAARKTSGASASAIAAYSYSIHDAKKTVSVLHIAHRREVYE
jgi:hypothetical protein